MRLRKGSNIIRLPKKVAKIERVILKKRGCHIGLCQVSCEEEFNGTPMITIEAIPMYFVLLEDKRTLKFFPRASQQFNAEILYYPELKVC